MYNQKYSKILGLDYHNKQPKVTIIWFYAKYKIKKLKIKYHDLSVFKPTKS
jgi:hypothetical protein